MLMPYYWDAKLSAWFSIFGEHLQEKRGKIAPSSCAQGQLANAGTDAIVWKTSEPPSQCKKNPTKKKPCSPPSPDWWSVLQWANNKAAQEVSASEARAWKELCERCPRRCSPSSPSASHWNPNSLAGDGDTVRAAGMQQLRQFGLRQLHPSAEPREQASPAR